MRNSIFRSVNPLLCAFASVVAASGCSDGRPFDPGTGGTVSAGGASGMSSGGTPAAFGGATQGGTVSAGGITSLGGTTNTSGGTTSTSAGGTPFGAGGAPSAGAPSAGAPGGGAAGATGSAGAPPTAGAAGAPGGDVYNPDFKEFVGEKCTVGTPMTMENAKLPDLFKWYDGTRMMKKADWACRRAELKKAVETYIHGPKPGKPTSVSGTVSATSITVKVEEGGKTVMFSVSVSIPANAKKPAPAIIGLGGGSLDKSILSAEGVASINYSNNTIADEKSRNGLFTNLYPNTGASAQVGWAWGVSRIIDVLVAEKAAGKNDLIDPTAIGVTGCSRLGKGAFTIGAFDERIALGIPQESGTGGVSAFRVVNTNPGGPNGKSAQTLASAWTEAQGWFGTAFDMWRTKVNQIPVDTHSLVAMYAPRGLLVLDNSRIGELGSSAQHAASAAGALVYKSLGVEKNIAYHGGNPSDPHNHCSFYASQAEPLRKAIRAHLTRTAPADGKIEPQPAGTADLTKWIDWDAPVLQ